MSNATQSTSMTGAARRVAASALALAVFVPGAALAGGLAVREQSTQFQGSSFAGNGAGGALSSSFWNSAAIGEAGWGLTTESAYSLILGRTEFSNASTVNPAFGTAGAEQDRPALVGASYASYRLNDRTVLGVAINAPFGLSSEPDNRNWAGQAHHRSSSLFTLNMNPMVSYQMAPGFYLGVGAQVQYAKLKFKTATAPGGPNGGLIGDDIGVGFTAGLLWKPAPGTSIGLGYRSSISHKIEGDLLNTPLKFAMDIDTPDMVTLSLRQALSANMRLLATIEWTHWDKLDIHPVVASTGATVANFDFRWRDGWFFALGGEYDYSRQLTLRAGAAYEISPIDDPTKRLPQVPDADRVWLSLGASYKLSETTSLDFGYSHVFVEDSHLRREPASVLGAGLFLDADVETSADILSVGYKMKWGGPSRLSEPLK